MRIGISGAAGTGKTTLCAALAEHLGCALVDDPTSDALSERGYSDWRAVRDPDTRRQIRMRSFQIKMRAEKDQTDWVSDKTVVDFLAYWLLNQAPFESRGRTLEVLDLVAEHMDTYDTILVLPWRRLIDPAPGRNDDPAHQLKIQACVEGLYRVLDVPVVRAEYTFGEDAAEVAARLLPQG